MRKVYYSNYELQKDSEDMDDEELNQWVVEYYEEMERPDNKSEVLTENKLYYVLKNGETGDMDIWE